MPFFYHMNNYAVNFNKWCIIGSYPGFYSHITLAHLPLCDRVLITCIIILTIVCGQYPAS